MPDGQEEVDHESVTNGQGTSRGNEAEHDDRDVRLVYGESFVSGEIQNGGGQGGEAPGVLCAFFLANHDCEVFGDSHPARYCRTHRSYRRRRTDRRRNEPEEVCRRCYTRNYYRLNPHRSHTLDNVFVEGVVFVHERLGTYASLVVLHSHRYHSQHSRMRTLSWSRRNHWSSMILSQTKDRCCSQTRCRSIHSIGALQTRRSSSQDCASLECRYGTSKASWARRFLKEVQVAFLHRP